MVPGAKMTPPTFSELPRPTTLWPRRWAMTDATAKGARSTRRILLGSCRRTHLNNICRIIWLQRSARA
eukprot:5536492-Pyramimonas_sp.AAC.1